MSIRRRPSEDKPHFRTAASNGRFDASDVLTGGDASTGDDGCSGGVGIGDDTF